MLETDSFHFVNQIGQFYGLIHELPISIAIINEGLWHFQNTVTDNIAVRYTVPAAHLAGSSYYLWIFFFLLGYYGYVGLIHFYNNLNTTRVLIGQNSMCYWAGKLIENCCNKCMNICKKNHNMRKYPLNGNRQFYCCLPGLWMKVRLELTLFW